jgi:hypothetical protein
MEKQEDMTANLVFHIRRDVVDPDGGQCRTVVRPNEMSYMH